jgi:hypothetical protein
VQRTESVPLSLRAVADGSRIVLFYSVRSGKKLCVNGHGLLPTALDTYPDHGQEGKVVRSSGNRVDVLKSYFSSDETIASVEIWQNSGASSIDVSDEVNNLVQDIEVNIEMAECSQLFSNRDSIDKFTFYKKIHISRGQSNYGDSLLNAELR